MSFKDAFALYLSMIIVSPCHTDDWFLISSTKIRVRPIFLTRTSTSSGNDTRQIIHYFDFFANTERAEQRNICATPMPAAGTKTFHIVLHKIFLFFSFSCSLFLSLSRPSSFVNTNSLSCPSPRKLHRYTEYLLAFTTVSYTLFSAIYANSSSYISSLASQPVSSRNTVQRGSNKAFPQIFRTFFIHHSLFQV